MKSKTKKQIKIVSTLFFILVGWIFFAHDTNAASTTSIAGTVTSAEAGDCNDVDADGTGLWSTTLSAYQTSDDTDGTYGGNAFDSGDFGAQLELSNFHFSTSDIPEGSIVDGIEVNMERGGSSGDIKDYKVWLTASSTVRKMGSNHATSTVAWSTVDQTSTFGGSGDLWSLDNTTGAATSSFNGYATSTSFGLIFCPAAIGANGTASVDRVTITIYYTPAALTQDGYRWRANHQAETGTTWLAAEDTALDGQNVSPGAVTASTTRLRILMDETSAIVATTTLYQLEYATSTIGSVCAGASTWVPVADQASTTSFAWKMSPTAQFANGGATTNIADPNGLTDTTGSFRAGTTQDTTGRLSSGIAHAAGEFTELEWSLEASALAYVNGQSYCFRATNADDTTNFTYSAYPKINLATTTQLEMLHYRWRADNGGQGPAGDPDSPWWDSNFLYRRKITFNNAPSAEKLTDFPMSIKLTEDVNDEWSAANIEYDNVLPHGNDIRFVTATTSAMMKHEIETWDTTATSTAWVKLPWLEAGTTTQHIWMYYGNSATTTGSATSSVWDTSFNGVWHLTETVTDETSNTGVHIDSTSYVRHADQGNNTNGAGRVANAQAFDGTADKITISNAAAATGDFTYSAWVHSLATGASKGVLGAGDGTTDDEILIEIDSAAEAVVMQLNNATVVTTTGTVAINTWTHLAFTRSGSAVTGYMNGVSDGSGTHGTALGFGSCSLYLGADAGTCSTFTKDLNARLDEFRISSIARSADWIQQEYRYGAASSTTHTFGSEGMDDGASFLADEDAHLTGANVATASTTRLRILVDETDSGATTTLYQLEYATSTIAGFTSCGVLTDWVEVPHAASTTSYAWTATSTANYVNRAATTNISSGLSDPSSGSFVAGQIMDKNSTTTAFEVTADNFTEIEWALMATPEADGDSYCFRVTNGGDTTDFTYSAYPRISVASSTVSFTQLDFRLYKNIDALNPVTAWDSLSENQAMTAANERMGGGSVVRIRTNVTAGGSLSGSSQSFVLQFAELPSGSACSSITSWTRVGAKDSSEVFRLFNTNQGDSTTITTTLLGSSDVGGLLSEINPTATNPNAATNQEIEYDWPVQYPSARYSGANFCFRMAEDDDTVFSGYTNYPQILTNIVGAGDNVTIGAPTGGSGAKGAATTTSGTGSGGSEEGGAPPAGGGNQGGGGGGGGGEVRIPFFRYFAGVLWGMMEFVVKVLRL